MALERLQKILARAGVASRRRAEQLISSGRVRVEGRIVTELGTKADPRIHVVELDGRRVVAEPPVYVVLHKPRAVISTLSDPEGRPSVGELVRDAGARVVPVGRLDFHTSGVLLLSNDGAFVHGLLHPSRGVPRIYVAKVRGEMSEKDLEAWRSGVQLDDAVTAKAEVRFLRHERGKTWFQITLREGMNRQIVRMGEATGFPVMRLARQSFAGIDIEGLRPGRWRHLTQDELEELHHAYGVPRRPSAARPTADGRVRKGRLRERSPVTEKAGPRPAKPSLPRASRAGRPSSKAASSRPRSDPRRSRNRG